MANGPKPQAWSQATGGNVFSGEIDKLSQESDQFIKDLEDYNYQGGDDILGNIRHMIRGSKYPGYNKSYYENIEKNTEILNKIAGQHDILNTENPNVIAELRASFNNARKNKYLKPSKELDSQINEYLADIIHERGNIKYGKEIGHRMTVKYASLKNLISKYSDNEVEGFSQAANQDWGSIKGLYEELRSYNDWFIRRGVGGEKQTIYDSHYNPSIWNDMEAMSTVLFNQNPNDKKWIQLDDALHGMEKTEWKLRRQDEIIKSIARETEQQSHPMDRFTSLNNVVLNDFNKIDILTKKIYEKGLQLVTQPDEYDESGGANITENDPKVQSELNNLNEQLDNLIERSSPFVRLFVQRGLDVIENDDIPLIDKDNVSDALMTISSMGDFSSGSVGSSGRYIETLFKYNANIFGLDENGNIDYSKIKGMLTPFDDALSLSESLKKQSIENNPTFHELLSDMEAGDTKTFNINSDDGDGQNIKMNAQGDNIKLEDNRENNKIPKKSDKPEFEWLLNELSLKTHTPGMAGYFDIFTKKEEKEIRGLFNEDQVGLLKGDNIWKFTEKLKMYYYHNNYTKNTIMAETLKKELSSLYESLYYHNEEIPKEESRGSMNIPEGHTFSPQGGLKAKPSDLDDIKNQMIELKKLIQEQNTQ